MEHRSLSPDIVVPNDDYACGNKRAGELAPDVAPEELRQEKQVGGPVNCSDSELCTFLLALEAGFLPTYCSDTNQSVRLKSMSIASKSYRRGKQTVLFHGFPSLRMSQNLMDDRGAVLLMSFVAGFRVRTSAQPEAATVSTASAPGSGAKWPESSVRYDPASSSWKTAHCLWEEDLPWSLVTLPTWGMTRNGSVYRHPTAERPISGIGAGLWPTVTCDSATERTGRYAQGGMPLTAAVQAATWPTPTVCGNYNRNGASATSGDGLATAVTQRTWPTATATATATASKGWSPNHNRAMTDDRLDYSVERESFRPGQQTPPMRLNPEWVEWLMGWPIGHTALEPLATDRYHEWLRQHSLCFLNGEAA